MIWHFLFMDVAASRHIFCQKCHIIGGKCHTIRLCGEILQEEYSSIKIKSQYCRWVGYEWQSFSLNCFYNKIIEKMLCLSTVATDSQFFEHFCYFLWLWLNKNLTDIIKYIIVEAQELTQKTLSHMALTQIESDSTCSYNITFAKRTLAQVNKI